MTIKTISKTYSIVKKSFHFIELKKIENQNMNIFSKVNNDFISAKI